jgi:hypothetical protein
MPTSITINHGPRQHGTHSGSSRSLTKGIVQQDLKICDIFSNRASAAFTMLQLRASSRPLILQCLNSQIKGTVNTFCGLKLRQADQIPQKGTIKLHIRVHVVIAFHVVWSHLPEPCGISNANHKLRFLQCFDNFR